MMMGVFWYYRQHHSEGEPVSKYLSNEVFASRHRDIIPVACIEDRCYVLTFNEFCRFVTFLVTYSGTGTHRNGVPVLF